MTKSPTPTEKQISDNAKTQPKCSIADRFRTFSWSNYCHPTGVNLPVNGNPAHTLTTKAVQSKGLNAESFQKYENMPKSKQIPTQCSLLAHYPKMRTKNKVAIDLSVFEPLVWIGYSVPREDDEELIRIPVVAKRLIELENRRRKLLSHDAQGERTGVEKEIGENLIVLQVHVRRYAEVCGGFIKIKRRSPNCRDSMDHGCLLLLM